MKKFKFRLQKVLEVKQHLEKMRQQELALLLDKLKTEKIFCEKYINERDDYRQMRTRTENQGARKSEILMIEQYLQHLKKKISHQHQIVDRLERAISEKQRELRKVMMDKKSMEKYRDKQHNEYEKTVLFSEQIFLDELAVRKFQPIPGVTTNSLRG